MNPKYVKAYHRRAKAYEQMGDLSSSLEDITATCILERFACQSTLVFADRVLKSLGSSHAKEAMINRPPIKPSKHFVKSFLSSFSNDPIMKIVVTSSDPKGFIKAKQALESYNFDDVIPACNDELAMSEAESDYKLEALLLRGTMYELTGEFEQARDDFLQVLVSDRPNSSALKANALIKRASIQIQMDKLEACFKDFEVSKSVMKSKFRDFSEKCLIFLVKMCSLFDLKLFLTTVFD